MGDVSEYLKILESIGITMQQTKTVLSKKKEQEEEAAKIKTIAAREVVAYASPQGGKPVHGGMNPGTPKPGGSRNSVRFSDSSKFQHTAHKGHFRRSKFPEPQKFFRMGLQQAQQAGKPTFKRKDKLHCYHCGGYHLKKNCPKLKKKLSAAAMNEVDSYHERVQRHSD